MYYILCNHKLLRNNLTAGDDLVLYGIKNCVKPKQGELTIFRVICISHLLNHENLR